MKKYKKVMKSKLGVFLMEEDDGNAVEGTTDTDEGVAAVKKVMLDSEPVGWTLVELDNGDGGEDEPP